MATNSKVSVTEGIGKNVTTYSLTEDAVTKDLQRVALNESDGSDTALAAKLGSLTETAPATDTASSGLNGRLQRIAQRVTSLIAATLATSMADGSNVTLGAKADAKSTATDTTAITAMSVWKQISASVQLMVFGAGTAAAAQRITHASDDPAVATLGATTGTKVVTDATGTLQQYLRGLVTFFANALGAGTAATATRVVTATDDAIHGALTETAPVTDTASSGLNGRLQRIAQRLSTLITAVGTQVYDSFGALRVNTEGGKASYKASVSNITPGVNGVMFVLQGSASKTVRITRIGVSGLLTTAAIVEVAIFRTTGDVSSPSGAATTAISKLDTANGAATAVSKNYTTSTIGAGSSQVSGKKIMGGAGATISPQEAAFEYGTRNAQAFVLRGTAEFMQLFLSASSWTGSSFDYEVEWAEE